MGPAAAAATPATATIAAAHAAHNGAGVAERAATRQQPRNPEAATAAGLATATGTELDEDIAPRWGVKKSKSGHCACFSPIADNRQGPWLGAGPSAGRTYCRVSTPAGPCHCSLLLPLAIPSTRVAKARRRRRRTAFFLAPRSWIQARAPHTHTRPTCHMRVQRQGGHATRQPHQPHSHAATRHSWIAGGGGGEDGEAPFTAAARRCSPP